MSSQLRVSLVCEQLLQAVPGGIGTYVRAMLTALPRAGVIVEPVTALHRARELADAGLSHARRLPLPRDALYRRWLRGGRPGVGGKASIVHAPSLAFPRRDGRPLVVTVHDLMFLEHAEAYTKRGHEFHTQALDRLSEADLVIVPSKATEQAVLALDDAPARVRVVAMGTDMQAPSEADTNAVLARLEVEQPYVLWVGTVEPRKNPEGVVRGFVEAVMSGVPRAEEMNLYLAGPRGWWSGEVRELVTERGLADRVRRIGEVARADLPALYAGAEAFVFPSFGEGFGLPVLEAMACGCPVVTSNVSSLPEVAGSAAELCDPNDVSSIGEALAKVLRDRELAHDLSRLGLRRAKDFTWERTGLATAACYREVLASA